MACELPGKERAPARSWAIVQGQEVEIINIPSGPQDSPDEFMLPLVRAMIPPAELLTSPTTPSFVPHCQQLDRSPELPSRPPQAFRITQSDSAEEPPYALSRVPRAGVFWVSSTRDRRDPVDAGVKSPGFAGEGVLSESPRSPPTNGTRHAVACAGVPAPWMAGAQLPQVEAAARRRTPWRGGAPTPPVGKVRALPLQARMQRERGRERRPRHARRGPFKIGRRRAIPKRH
jgi:hypothetical protein